MSTSWVAKTVSLTILWMGFISLPISVDAQVQNFVTLPRTTLNDSFYESYGFGFGMNRMGPNGGFFFNNGGGAVPPPFGGFDPNAGATFGVGTGNSRFNFSAAQGSSRTMVSEAPMLMVPNGGGGSFFSGTQRPFVTGIVPVVGAGGPTVINPLQQKLQQLRERGESLTPTPEREPDSAAPRPATKKPAEDAPLILGRAAIGRPAMTGGSAPSGSLSALRHQRERELAAQREEARQRIMAARQAEDEGRFALARSEFTLALRLVQPDDPWRLKIIERLRAIAKQSEQSSATSSNP